MDLLLHEVLWIWGHYCYSLHPRKKLRVLLEFLHNIPPSHSLTYNRPFIHTLTYNKLLAPADSELNDPCLTGPITEYSWAEGIVLITVFMMFSIQLIAKIVVRKINRKIGSSGHSLDDIERYSDQNVGGEDSDLSRPGRGNSYPAQQTALDDGEIHSAPNTGGQNGNRSPPDNQNSCPAQPTAPHIDQNPRGQNGHRSRDSYAANLIGVLILEFGIMFHSLFIGFNLAVAGDEFYTLYIVIIFHQLFEGLALGSRLADNPFLEEHKRIQYSMGFAYGLTTPIAIGIGLGVQTVYSPNSQTALVVNGIFDSISAGILIYTGLVDLMGREFLFLDAPNPVRAWGTMCLGAGKGLFLLACELISSLSVVLQRSWPSSANGPRFGSCPRFCRVPFALLA